MTRSRLSGPILAQLTQPAAVKPRAVPAWGIKRQQHLPWGPWSITFDHYAQSVRPTSRLFSTSSIASLHASLPSHCAHSSGRPSFLATYTQRAAKSTTSSPSKAPSDSSSNSDSTFADPDHRAMSSGECTNPPLTSPCIVLLLLLPPLLSSIS